MSGTIRREGSYRIGRKGKGGFLRSCVEWFGVPHKFPSRKAAKRLAEAAFGHKRARVSRA